MDRCHISVQIVGYDLIGWDRSPRDGGAGPRFAPIVEIPGHSRFSRFNSRSEAKNFPCRGAGLARKPLFDIMFFVLEGVGNRCFSDKFPSHGNF
jgi:hypothetical protein